MCQMEIMKLHRLESPTLIVLMKKNSRFCCWHPGHDKQWFLRFNQVSNPGHVSVKVSYQAACAWRHLLFLIQDEKMPIFITCHEWEGNAHLHSIRTNSSIFSYRTCFAFSQMAKSSVRIRWWFIRTTSDLLFPKICTDIDENQIFLFP